MSWGKVAFCRWLRELVPGAEQLAVVAAIDSVAHRFSKLDGNAAVQFDGQVRDTTTCVEFIRRNDRSRWADIDAGTTSATVRGFTFVGWQRKVDVQLAQEKP